MNNETVGLLAGKVVLMVGGTSGIGEAAAKPAVIAKAESGVHPLAKLRPLGRIAESEEVAQAALFLLSDRASFITGQVLNVDGGLTSQ